MKDKKQSMEIRSNKKVKIGEIFPSKFTVNFIDDKGIIIEVSMPSKEVHTLANAFYNYLLDLGIEKVTIKKKDK